MVNFWPYIGTTEPRRSDRKPHRWAVVRCWKCKCIILVVCTEKLHYGGLGMSENKSHMCRLLKWNWNKTIWSTSTWNLVSVIFQFHFKCAPGFTVVDKTNAETKRVVTSRSSWRRTARRRRRWYKHARVIRLICDFMLSSESKKTPRSRTT